MISVEDAVEIFKANCPKIGCEEVALSDSLNRVLAEKIISSINSPSYTNSAMDGFAIRWQDIKQTDETNLCSLIIIGESAAGNPFTGEIKTGEAIRISTGAMLPNSADTVVPIEQCSVTGNTLSIHSVKIKGQHIRAAGEEFKVGQELLFSGTKIGSSHIALLATLGKAKVIVGKKPHVTILTTGSELIAVGKKSKHHHIYDSNTPMLSAAVIEATANIKQTIHLMDDPILTKKALSTAVENSDIILTSGGVSMGVHDHVRDMALEAGFEELFWKVRQKPGKPMFVAKKEGTLLIALPGNPVSAYICFKHYVRPLLFMMQGMPFEWKKVKSKTLNLIENRGDRTILMRARLIPNQHDISTDRKSVV